ncbi:MAG TPA: radical SAM protein [Porphyromonadaceae bacterium]|nr:radical SAM protein [Porphyromonadaceae bacterium]
MRIALHDSEYGMKYPNVALMKLSAWHKSLGDSVEWFNPVLGNFDKVYSSKVFTWTPEDPYLPSDTIKGGTGYGLSTVLPEVIEHICPDYSLYDCQQSYGFLTRGCPNKCSWCFVPDKEGEIKPHADVDEFCRHKDVVLMDNNVLAHQHGIEQIEKMIKLGLHVDFNQGLDARLIDNGIAKLLGRLKWKPQIRLACDSMAMIKHVRNAVELLRWHNATPSAYFCYVLVKDIEDAVERVKFLKGIYVYPFAQAYRDKEGNEPTQEQHDFCRWVNHKAIYKTTTWEDYDKQSKKVDNRQLSLV